MSRAVLIARAAWLIYRLHLKADLPPPGASRFSLAPDHGFSAGGHGGAAIPVPIPNTEVKGSFAEGSAGPARARVGRRRPFPFPHPTRTARIALTCGREGRGAQMEGRPGPPLFHFRDFWYNTTVKDGRSVPSRRLFGRLVAFAFLRDPIPRGCLGFAPFSPSRQTGTCAG